jgi:hypothetical protein
MLKVPVFHGLMICAVQKLIDCGQNVRRWKGLV